MWKLESTDEYESRHRTYQKKHPRELAAVLDNLDTYFQSLQAGVKPLQIKHGFMHHEGRGVVAIDQKGGGPKLAQTRLYVSPDVDAELLYLITLGDKRSQKADLRTCGGFLDQLTNEEHNKHEQGETA